MGSDRDTQTPASFSLGTGIAVGVVVGTIVIGVMVAGWSIHRNRRRRAEQTANSLPVHNRDVHRLSGDTIAVPPEAHQPRDRRAHRNVPLPNMVIELEDFDYRGRPLTRPVQRSDLEDFRPATGMYAFASLEDQHRSHLERQGHVVRTREPGLRVPTTMPDRPPPIPPSRPRPNIRFVTEDGRDVGPGDQDAQVIVVPDYIPNRTVPRRPRRPRRPATPDDGYIIPLVLRGVRSESSSPPPEFRSYPLEMYGLGPEMVGLGNPFDQEGLRHGTESVDTLPRYESPPPEYAVIDPRSAENDFQQESTQAAQKTRC